MGTAEAAATVFGTRLRLVAARGRSREITWRNTVALARYLWFCVAASLAFFMKLLAGRVFRPGREEESCKQGDTSSGSPVPLVPMAESGKSEEEEEGSPDEGKGSSAFQFRFSYQVPEESKNDRGQRRGSTGKDEGSSITTSISNYRCTSTTDYRGFMEAPQAVTLCVQESYVDSTGTARGSTEESSRSLSTRCSQEVDLDVSVAERLDRELNSMFVGVVVLDEEPEHKSMCTANLSRPDAPAELGLPDLGLPNEAGVPTGARFLPAGGASGFASDSELDSRSDGYSVKDLVVDSDSDGFFSEGDSETEIDRPSLFGLQREIEGCVGCREKTEAVQLPSSPGCAGISGDFREESIHPLEDTKNHVEINLENVENCGAEHRYTTTTGSSSICGDVLPRGDLCAAEVESEQVHWEGRDQKELIKDFNYSIDEQSIVKVGLHSEHVSKPQTEAILSEAERAGEESESLETQEMEGAQSPNYCASNKESFNFGVGDQNTNNQDLSERDPAASSSKSNGVNGKEAPERVGTGLTTTTHSPDVASLPWKNSDEPNQGQEGPQDSTEIHLTEKSELSMGDMEEEALLEHQDLIDQLKMELKKARAAGLPTIMEESESVGLADGLKPWKADARFLHEDPMKELDKLHKIYREKMKKLDVLNYQKMHAIGFLQLKGPLQSLGTHKYIIPTIASVLSRKVWPHHRWLPSSDPSEEFIKELQSDLEMVYVGQLCISWEFLHWQYEKTRELLGSDPHDGHQYNQMAGEFQQFQVLIQRFLENEPFQGPRVLNYAKNRCALRNLLQVPGLREDCLKDHVDKGRKKDAITSEQLEYIMEDAIRTFWAFIKAEKDETPMIMKALVGTHAELQDPTDLELMVDIQVNLKQKQKKLKDVVRTSSCLVKKFKKPQQVTSNQDDLFFSQVDLKLVSRVLKMSRITTHQLEWCHKKLTKISFVDRKLLREPSFLLFPC